MAKGLPKETGPPPNYPPHGGISEGVTFRWGKNLRTGRLIPFSLKSSQAGHSPAGQAKMAGTFTVSKPTQWSDWRLRE